MIPFVLDDFAKAIHHPIVLISTFGSVVLQLPSVTVISHHSCRIFRSARRLLHTGLDYIKRIPGEGCAEISLLHLERESECKVTL